MSFEKYQQNIDLAYAYNLINILSEDRFINNKDLGGRNAGSKAEHAAARFLMEEMKNIGLEEVRLEEFESVEWEFRKAELRLTEPHREDKIALYAFPSVGTPPEGINAEIIDVNKGTKADYLGLNAEGRIVLADVDLLEDWWVSFVALEAKLHNASAVIIYCTKGYGQRHETAMVAANLAASGDIPVLSMSKKDALALKSLLRERPLTAGLTVDSTYKQNGISCNVVGKIRGVRSDELILTGNHYDMHFSGAMDNNSGTALTLSVAKSMVQSDYRPNRDIVFILHGSEENGAKDSYYDWAIGSYKSIAEIHPEWVGKAILYINFELPGLAISDKAFTTTPPSLFTYIKDFSQKSVKPEGCFLNSIKTERCYPQLILSDDWPYNANGVPSIMNGNKFDDAGAYYKEYLDIYHTQFDTAEVFDANAFLFNAGFFGQLIMDMDSLLLAPLDFSNEAELLSLDGQDQDFLYGFEGYLSYRDAVTELKSRTETLYSGLTDINAGFIRKGSANRIRKDLSKNPAGHTGSLYEKAHSINCKALEVFRIYQSEILKLGNEGETLMIGHRHILNNLKLLDLCISALKREEPDKALESLQKIEDEKYSFYFSREVVDHINLQKYAPEYEEKRFWGKGKLTEPVDLYDTIQRLRQGPPSSGHCYDREILELTIWKEKQTDVLNRILSDEAASVGKINRIISDILTELPELDKAI